MRMQSMDAFVARSFSYLHGHCLYFALVTYYALMAPRYHKQDSIHCKMRHLIVMIDRCR